MKKMSQLMVDYRFEQIRRREEQEAKLERDMDKFQIKMNGHMNDIMFNFRKNIRTK